MPTKVRQDQKRVFQSKVFYDDKGGSQRVAEAQALQWVLAMEDEGWNCSRISKLFGGGHVALVWKWV